MTDGRRKLKTDDMYAEFPSGESITKEYLLVTFLSVLTFIAVVFYIFRDEIFIQQKEVRVFGLNMMLILLVLALIYSSVYLKRRIAFQKAWRNGEFVIEIRKCVKREKVVDIYRRSHISVHVKYYLTFDTDEKILVFKDLYKSTEEGDLFYMVRLASYKRIFSCNEWVLDERFSHLLTHDKTNP